MFNHFLVAIDFASQPKLIYKYGLDLGNHLGCTLELVNIFHPTQIKGRLRSSKGAGELHSYFDDRMQKLRPAALNRKSKRSSLTDKTVVQGFPEIELIKSSKKPDIDLLIMGIRGFSYPFNEEFGDVVTGVSHDSQCPVLLLPSDIEFSGFQKILFLNDRETIDATLIDQIIGFAFLFNAEVHFIHIDHQTKGNREEEKRNEFEAGMEKFQSTNYTFSYSKVQNLLVNVNKQIERHQIKMLHISSFNRFLWFDFLKLQMKNTFSLSRNIPIFINHLDS